MRPKIKKTIIFFLKSSKYSKKKVKKNLNFSKIFIDVLHRKYIDIDDHSEDPDTASASGVYHCSHLGEREFKKIKHYILKKIFG